MKLIFATNNTHKLHEVREIIGADVEILSLSDLGCTDDIAETADTLEGNAHLKAKYIFDKYGVDCFADDTGLEVHVLHGEPGVYSARYAGDGHDSQANRNKLLQNLQGQSDRSAQFRTALVLLLNGKEYLFEGIVKGRIIAEEKGTNGFGYDSIFIPEGYDNTFAELAASVKNNISHRADAVRKLAAFLKEINSK